MSEPRIIKRYSNRKLYDTEQSKYVKLQDIAILVKDGVDVRILDKESNEDLTGVTLAQILLDAEKRNERTLPLSAITEILRSSGTKIQKSLGQQVTIIREEAERTVAGLREETEKQLRGIKEKTNFDDLRMQVRNIVQQAQYNLDDIQTRIEERIHNADNIPTDETPIEAPSIQQEDLLSDNDRQHGSPVFNTTRMHLLEERIQALEAVVAQLIIRESPSARPEQPEGKDI